MSPEKKVEKEDGSWEDVLSSVRAFVLSPYSLLLQDEESEEEEGDDSDDEGSDAGSGSEQDDDDSSEQEVSACSLVVLHFHAQVAEEGENQDVAEEGAAEAEEKSADDGADALSLEDALKNYDKQTRNVDARIARKKCSEEALAAAAARKAMRVARQRAKCSGKHTEKQKKSDITMAIRERMYERADGEDRQVLQEVCVSVSFAPLICVRDRVCATPSAAGAKRLFVSLTLRSIPCANTALASKAPSTELLLTGDFMKITICRAHSVSCAVCFFFRRSLLMLLCYRQPRCDH